MKTKDDGGYVYRLPDLENESYCIADAMQQLFSPPEWVLWIGFIGGLLLIFYPVFVWLNDREGR